MVYEPREDSFLLATFVRDKSKGVVLDMGTGSGIQARTAADVKGVKQVFAADIDPEAIAYAKKHNKHEKIKYIQSDLFAKFSAKKWKNAFDTIIFNSPYLPQDHRDRNLALYGGKKGYEVLQRFIHELNNYLKADGIAMIAFSSHTGRDRVEQIINQNLMEWKELGKQHIFFEDIFVYSLKRKKISDNIHKEGISDLKFFDRGKRGLIFTGTYRKKKVAIKVKNPKSEAPDSIPNEAKWLKELNKHGIGQKYILHKPGFLVYEFVDGELVQDWLPKASARIIKTVLKKLFDQGRKLDLLHINKKEMTRPLKNAIVKGTKITLIDFERAHKTKDPHNITQLTQFLRNRRAILSKKGIKINVKTLENRARAYSDDPTDENYKKIISLLK